MKYAHKVDQNQREIVEALRSVGCSVYITSAVGRDFPDLVVGTPFTPPDWVTRRGNTVLIEIKTETGEVSDGQRKFITEFNGACAVVRTVEEALLVIGKKTQ